MWRSSTCFEFVIIPHLSQWSSLIIFIAYSSKPLPDSSVMRISRSRKAHIVSPYSVWLDILNRTDSSMVSCNVLTILCCCTALIACTSSTNVPSHALETSDLKWHLAASCCRLKERAAWTYAMSMRTKTHNYRDRLFIPRGWQKNVDGDQTKHFDHTTYASKQTESSLTFFLEHHTWSKPTNKQTSVQESGSTVAYTDILTFQPLKLFHKPITNYKYYGSNSCHMEGVQRQNIQPKYFLKNFLPNILPLDACQMARSTVIN